MIDEIAAEALYIVVSSVCMSLGGVLAVGLIAMGFAWLAYSHRIEWGEENERR